MNKGKAEYNEILLKILNEANQSEKLNIFIDILHDILLEELNIKSAGSYLLNQDNFCMEIYLLENLPESFIERYSKINFYQKPFRDVFNKQEILISSNLEEDNDRLFKLTDFHSLAFVPVIYEKEIIGAIILGDRDKGKFNENTYKFFELLGQYLGPVFNKFNSLESDYRNEENFRNIFDHSLNGIALHKIILDSNQDPIDFEYIDMNKEFENLLGMGKEFIIGKKGSELKELLPEIYFELFKKIMISAQLIDYEYFSPKRNRYYKISAFSYKRDYYTIIVTDISESKLVENVIKDSENNLQTLFNTINDFLFVLDLNGDVLKINNTVQDVLQYSNRELLNMNFIQLHPEDKKEKVNHLLGKLNDSEYSIFKIPFVTKDSELIPVETKISKGIWSGKNVYFASCRDIRLFLEAEEKIRQSRKRFEDIAHSSADFIWELNTEKKYSFAAGNVKELLGYSQDEILGKCPLEMMAEKEAKTLADVLDIAITNAFPIMDHEHWKTGKDGRDVCILTSAVPISGPDGSVIGLRGVDKDITFRKKAELENIRLLQQIQIAKDSVEQQAKELQDLNEKLTESEKDLIEINKTKDKFFSIISHDLRSPFTALLGYSQMLSENYEIFEDDEKKEFISDIHTTGKQLFKLLENLLQWARSQTGNMEYSPTPIYLKEISEDIVALQKTNAEKKNNNLFTDIGDNIIAWADNNMSTTVIRNLVSNAMKFTDGGDIRISAAKKDEFIEVSVNDSGLGMSEENMNKLFKIDQHYTTKGTDDESGTGLGLILCKDFVENNGGTIWVESELGKGSSFIFTLPVYNGQDESE